MNNTTVGLICLLIGLAVGYYGPQLKDGGAKIRKEAAFIELTEENATLEQSLEEAESEAKKLGVEVPKLRARVTSLTAELEGLKASADAPEPEPEDEDPQLAALAARASAEGTKLGEVEYDGRTLTDVLINSADEVGLSVTHSAGVGRLSYDKLPVEIQERFGYDPEEASKVLEQESEQLKKRAAEARAPKPTATSREKAPPPRPTVNRAHLITSARHCKIGWGTRYLDGRIKSPTLWHAAVECTVGGKRVYVQPAAASGLATGQKFPYACIRLGDTGWTPTGKNGFGTNTKYKHLFVK